jgi:Zn-dependent protease with chaperone function
LFGYHNAFACFPLVLGFIPTRNNPFLFVSEGFFEDLSQEEQRFLIGHEIAHIKERHTVYLNLISYALLLLFLMLSWLLRKYIKLISKKITIKYSSALSNSISCIFFFTCMLSAEIIEFSYRRSIEKEADIKSISMLKTYAGFIKLMDKYEKEIKVPEQTSYFGLLADHPTFAERKNYCLEMKICSSDQFNKTS